MNKKIVLIASLFCGFTVGCSKAELQFGQLRTDASSSQIPAPTSYQVNAGSATLSGGGYIIKGQVKSNQATVLSGGGYKIYGEIQK